MTLLTGTPSNENRNRCAHGLRRVYGGWGLCQEPAAGLEREFTCRYDSIISSFYRDRTLAYHGFRGCFGCRSSLRALPFPTHSIGIWQIPVKGRRNVPGSMFWRDSFFAMIISGITANLNKLYVRLTELRYAPRAGKTPRSIPIRPRCQDPRCFSAQSSFVFGSGRPLSADRPFHDITFLLKYRHSCFVPEVPRFKEGKSSARSFLVDHSRLHGLCVFEWREAG